MSPKTPTARKAAPMGETERIRWEPTNYGGWIGHVGTLEPWAFQIFKTGLGYVGWSLTAQLPGSLGKGCQNDDPDELKAKAERWLAEFISSLGAIFPDCPAVTRFEAIDHTKGLASISPTSVRAVVAYGISAELSLQDDGRTLKVFLTDPAKEADQ